MSELNDLEAQLRALAPTAAIDRDAVLFRAGRASTPRPWGWIAATVLSTSAAILLALRPVPAPPPTTAPQPAPELIEPSAPPPALLAPPLRRLEEQLLDGGLDALGPVEPLSPPSLPPGDIGS